MSGKIDGKDIVIPASGITSTYYTSSGDAVNSFGTSAALDASGSQLNFFVDDLKNGAITIAPKLGTSSNPGNPNVKVLATGGGSTVQTYVQYINAGNTYYAISGTITITITDTSVSVKWEISFKDATGRIFTSSGSYTIVNYITTNVKSKTEVKDPTPVATKPTIDNIAPTAGAAGDEVAIAGTNFSTTLTDNIVMFNGVAATVKTATATRLTVTVPTGTTGAITVKVKNSETTTGPVFTYVLPPTFSLMSPTSGKAGDVITLTGSNFSTTLSDNVVAFNGINATVQSATLTGMAVVVPAGATTGLVTIKVRGKDAALNSGNTGIFTVTAVTGPGVAAGLPGTFAFTAKAVDNEGNLYVVDENQQLYKMSPDGTLLKTFTKNDITFKSMLTYKCVAITNNKKGAIRALFYCGTFPSGQAEVDMVAIGTSGTISKEFSTTLFDTNHLGMSVTSTGEYFVLSSHYGTDDVVKISADGATISAYLKGGAGGDFGGNGAYSMDIDDNGNLFILSYLKGQFANSIPTAQAIYKFDSSKARTTILGSYTDGYVDGDLTTTAKFKDIRCLAVTGSDLFIGDNGNYRIRKINLSSRAVTTVAGNGKQFDAANGNQPTYAGTVLGVNMLGSNGLLWSASYGTLYNFTLGQSVTQKFVF